MSIEGSKAGEWGEGTGRYASGASGSRARVELIDDSLGGLDCDGHGTHVAAIAAGLTYGVSKNATVHAIKVLSPPHIDALVS